MQRKPGGGEASGSQTSPGAGSYVIRITETSFRRSG
jgi:hypothetical protein